MSGLVGKRGDLSDTRVGISLRHVSLGTAEESRHPRRQSGPKVRLKVEPDGTMPFDIAMNVIGCETELSKAELLEVTDRTIRRAKLGTIGEDFIAKTLAAVAPHARKLAREGLKPTFECFFEVVG